MAVTVPEIAILKTKGKGSCKEAEMSIRKQYLKAAHLLLFQNLNRTKSISFAICRTKRTG
jgi:hypothetical protein